MTETVDASVQRTWIGGEDRVRFLLEANPNALVMAGEDGLIAFVNRRAASAFGYEPEELVGRPIEILVPPRIAERHARHRESFHAAPRHRQMGIGLDLTAQRKDGSEFPVEVALSPFYLDGRRQVIAAVVDITERKEKQQARDAFIDVLSHELRTPITTIYGASKLILRDQNEMDSRHAAILADLAEEADRLNRIVENLLVLAKLERGAEAPPIEPVLLQRVVAQIVRQERALNPRLAVNVAQLDGLPPVAADETYVIQVVRNLISNAAKYGPPEGPVDIEAAATTTVVQLRILDRGTALAEDEYTKIFDLYYRSPSTTRRASGAGIGLFVSQHLVQTLGGRIWACGRPGGGSEFGFELPAYEGREPHAA